MTTEDKRTWLHRHGILASDRFQPICGKYRVVWVPYRGSRLESFGETIDEAYDNTFKAIKNILFKACR